MVGRLGRYMSIDIGPKAASIPSTQMTLLAVLPA